MLTASDVTKEATRLVGGDRQSTHGDKVANHVAIAALWNGYLEARRVAGKPIALGPEDVANMQEALKIARRLIGAFNADDYVDGAGYAGVAGEIRTRMDAAPMSWARTLMAVVPERPCDSE
jgi:hypothetical protein